MSLDAFQSFLGTTYICEDGWTTTRPDGPHLEIRANLDTGREEITGLPQILDEDAAGDYADLLSRSVGPAVIQLLLTTRERNHPLKHGLVQHPLPTVQGGISYTSPLWDVSSIFLDPDLRIPATEERDAGGWFAPDADPNQFGALFAHPLVDRRNYRTYWRVGQVGITTNTHLGEAMWNDDAGCARLFDMVAGNDFEPHLVSLALSTDAQELQAMRHRQQERTEVLQAREAFIPRSRRVKPRLVGQLARQAYNTLPREWKTALDQSGRSLTCDEVSLSADDADMPTGTPRVHAAIRVFFSAPPPAPRRSITVPVDPPAEAFDAYAARLAELLGPGEGTLYRMTSPNRPPGFLITKIIEKVRELPEAFRPIVFPNSTWHEFESPGVWRPLD